MISFGHKFGAPKSTLKNFNIRFASPPLSCEEDGSPSICTLPFLFHQEICPSPLLQLVLVQVSTKNYKERYFKWKRVRTFFTHIRAHVSVTLVASHASWASYIHVLMHLIPYAPIHPCTSCISCTCPSLISPLHALRTIQPHVPHILHSLFSTASSLYQSIKDEIKRLIVQEQTQR